MMPPGNRNTKQRADNCCATVIESAVNKFAPEAS